MEITQRDIIKAAEHIRDVSLALMNSTSANPMNREGYRQGAMSKIEGLKTLCTVVGLDTRAPLSIVLHNIWKQILKD